MQKYMKSFSTVCQILFFLSSDVYFIMKPRAEFKTLCKQSKIYQQIRKSRLGHKNVHILFHTSCWNASIQIVIVFFYFITILQLILVLKIGKYKWNHNKQISTTPKSRGKRGKGDKWSKLRQITYSYLDIVWFLWMFLIIEFLVQCRNI